MNPGGIMGMGGMGDYGMNSGGMMGMGGPVMNPSEITVKMLDMGMERENGKTRKCVEDDNDNC